MMKLGIFIEPCGHHMASWLHPDANPNAAGEIEHYIRLARMAEDACFDLVFIADSMAVRGAHSLDDDNIEALSHSADVVALDPFSLLTALATCTTRIGLVATATTTYNDPFSLARRTATLDHISHGRAG